MTKFPTLQYLIHVFDYTITFEIVCKKLDLNAYFKDLCCTNINTPKICFQKEQKYVFIVFIKTNQMIE